MSAPEKILECVAEEKKMQEQNLLGKVQTFICFRESAVLCIVLRASRRRVFGKRILFQILFL